MSRSSQRLRPSVYGALLVLTIVVAALVLGNLSNSATRRTAAGAPVDIPAPVGLHMASQAPVPVLQYMGAQVWTGTDLVAVGSETQFGGGGTTLGAAYNPASGEWRTLSQPPFDQPLGQITGVWVDGKLVVAGVLCDNRATEEQGERQCYPGQFAAASYDVAADSWTSLPDPPGVELEPGNQGYFGAAVGAFGSSAVFQIGDAYWALDVDKQSWLQLPNPPKQARVCDLNGRLLSVGMSSQNPIVEKEGRIQEQITVEELAADVSAWTPRNSLETTVDTPIFLDFVCGDATILLQDSSLDLLWLYDVDTDSWAQQPSASADLTRRPPPGGSNSGDLNLPVSLPFKGWTGRMFVFWTPDGAQQQDKNGDTLPPWAGSALAFDPAKKTWLKATPGGDGDNLIWVNGTGLAIGSLANSPVGIVTYNPV